MQFFSKVMQSVPHEREIRAYCEKRIAELEAHMPVLELYRTGGFGWSYKPAGVANRQIEALKNVLEQLGNQESIEVKTANINHISKLDSISPFGRDVRAILENGQPELPEKLGDVSVFLHSEKLKREAMERQMQAERSARAKQEKRRRQDLEASQAEERQKLAEKLGIDPKKLIA